MPSTLQSASTPAHEMPCSPPNCFNKICRRLEPSPGIVSNTIVLSPYRDVACALLLQTGAPHRGYAELTANRWTQALSLQAVPDLPESAFPSRVFYRVPWKRRLS